jgi:two-component system, chemotaxis family, chemotaxis protein CheY
METLSMVNSMAPKTTILIVDDNVHMRTLLKTVLKDLQNVTVREAIDPIQAMEVLRAYPIALVITDLAMPNMTGIEFAKLIRSGADGIDRFLPIIMITGHTEISKIHEARDAGINEILAKPINAKALFERMTLVIAGTRPFVQAPSYFGPCRRRLTVAPPNAPRRRQSDLVVD